MQTFLLPHELKWCFHEIMGLIDQERNFLQKRKVLKVLFLDVKFLVVIYLNTRIIIFVNPFTSPVIPTRLHTSGWELSSAPSAET